MTSNVYPFNFDSSFLAFQDIIEGQYGERKKSIIFPIFHVTCICLSCHSFSFPLLFLSFLFSGGASISQSGSRTAQASAALHVAVEGWKSAMLTWILAVSTESLPSHRSRPSGRPYNQVAIIIVRDSGRRVAASRGILILRLWLASDL